MRIALAGAKYPIHERTCTNWKGLREAIRETRHEWVFLDQRYDYQFADKAIEFKPDLIIYLLDDIIYNQLEARKIAKALPDTKKVLWFGDYRDDEVASVPKIDCSDILDAMFVSNNGQKEFYEGKYNIPTYFLPLSCYKVPERQYNPRFNYNAVFIGSMIEGKGKWGERAKLINQIAQKEDITIINSVDPVKRAVINELMPEIYGSSLFSLDISHFWHIDKYTSNRGWVIPMMYGVALTKRFPGCYDLYPEGTKIYFDTAEEAIEKMRYYKEHPKELEKIRKAGHEHTLKYHTYEQRLNKMFNILWQKTK